MIMDQLKSIPKQDRTVLRVKLHELSDVLKKMTNAFRRAESEEPVSLLEPQMVNRLRGLMREFEFLESVEESQGETFLSLILNLMGIVQNIGTVANRSRKKIERGEQMMKILSSLRNLEEKIKEFLPLVVSLDAEARKKQFESFGGVLQKLIDAIQEKRYFILRRAEIAESDLISPEKKKNDSGLRVTP